MTKTKMLLLGKKISISPNCHLLNLPKTVMILRLCNLRKQFVWGGEKERRNDVSGKDGKRFRIISSVEVPLLQD